MSERNPPDNHPRLSGDDGADTPAWIDELYRNPEPAGPTGDMPPADMPPAEIDANIMQAAAKKLETPPSRRFGKPGRWASALASAAVLVVTVSVFLSGEMTEQILPRQEQAPTAPVASELVNEPATNVGLLRVQAPAPSADAVNTGDPAGTPAEAPQRTLADIPKTAFVSSPAVEKKVKIELDEAVARAAQREISTAQLASADTTSSARAFAPLQNCEMVQLGVCSLDELQFVVHPDCPQRFQLPAGASNVSHADDGLEVEEGVITFLDESISHQVQCVDGAWSVLPLKR